MCSRGLLASSTELSARARKVKGKIKKKIMRTIVPTSKHYTQIRTAKTVIQHQLSRARRAECLDKAGGFYEQQSTIEFQFTGRVGGG